MKLRDYIEQQGYSHTESLGDVLLGAIESKSIGSPEEALDMLDVEMHELLEKLGIQGRIQVEHLLEKLQFITRMGDDFLASIHDSRLPLSLEDWKHLKDYYVLRDPSDPISLREVLTQKKILEALGWDTSKIDWDKLTQYSLAEWWNDEKIEDVAKIRRSLLVLIREISEAKDLLVKNEGQDDDNDDWD